MASVTNFLSEKKKTANQELAAEWGTIEELYNEK